MEAISKVYHHGWGEGTQPWRGPSWNLQHTNFRKAFLWSCIAPARKNRHEGWQIKVFWLLRWFLKICPKKAAAYNPKEFLRINYELTQSIHEAWFPLDTVDDGHKHLCIFSFDKSLPDILNSLHKAEGKFSTSLKGQIKLGFCNSENFDAITKRIEKTLELKKLYGDKWWEYDDGE